jgi:APA family basic amino acid/polyamine antiporter
MDNNTQDQKRELGLLDSTMIVVGSMIGSGIFIVTADVARNVGGAGFVLLTWVITGLMTLIGAISYGELAGMMPKVGGQFIYLKEAYGKLTAFLFGWCTFLVIQTGTIAAVAVAFAKYTGVLLPDYISENIYVLEFGVVHISSVQLLAVVSIIILTFLNLSGVKEAKFVQLVLTLVKAVALAGLIVLGILFGLKLNYLQANWANAWDSFSTNAQGGITPISGFTLISVIGLSMVGPLFSSSAWNNITYTAGEVKDPKRDIPLSLFYGTLGVSSLYILANVAYLMVLPLAGQSDAADVAGRGIMFASNDRVGTAAAQQIFGSLGTIIMAIFIMISTFGCNNGLLLAGSRVYYSMARENLFFKQVGQLNKNGVPGFSLKLQSFWACLLCLSGTYGALLDYTVFTVLIFYVLTIVAIFILRQKQPNADRPYKAFGYPIIPAIYVLLAAGLCINLLIFRTETSLIGLFIVALGFPVYYFWSRNK